MVMNSDDIIRKKKNLFYNLQIFCSSWESNSKHRARQVCLASMMVQYREIYLYPKLNTIYSSGSSGSRFRCMDGWMN